MIIMILTFNLVCIFKKIGKVTYLNIKRYFLNKKITANSRLSLRFVGDFPFKLLMKIRNIFQ